MCLGHFRTKTIKVKLKPRINNEQVGIKNRSIEVNKDYLGCKSDKTVDTLDENQVRRTKS